MSRLKIYDTSTPREAIEAERERHFVECSPQEKLEHLFALIGTAQAMNGGKPLKKPKGKGLIISRKK